MQTQTPAPQILDPSDPLPADELAKIDADLSDILTRYAEVSRRLTTMELINPYNIEATRAGNFLRWMLHHARGTLTEIRRLQSKPAPRPPSAAIIHENDFDHED